MATDLTRLSRHSRITVKIGSSLLVDPDTGLKQAWLAAICDDIAALQQQGTQILVVSSGAIALGRSVLSMRRGPLRLEESQAAASAGQIALARAWAEALGRNGVPAGQILLTLEDTQARRRYLNARSTINTLLKLGSVPVINENDSVATTEIRYGDNDRLAARVATMAGSDLLVLLSDIDGLYDRPPTEDPEARFVGEVDQITPEIEAMAGAAGTELSRGGMVTKIEAGKIAGAAGTAMVIASGKDMHPLARLARTGHGTWFAANGTPVTARKKWISGQLPASGRLELDDGAIAALRKGRSLLPAGVRAVSGSFARGDIVALHDTSGGIVGQGICAYDHDDAARIAGRQSTEIGQILGYAGRSEMIHRDDLVLKPAHEPAPAAQARRTQGATPDA